MAFRIMLSDGGLFCSICKDSVTATTTVCGSCGASLVDTLEGKPCDSCGGPLPAKAKECPKCGVVFDVPSVREVNLADDEEFLDRLLAWGQKPSVQEETADDKLEQKLATEMFAKAVGGEVESEDIPMVEVVSEEGFDEYYDGDEGDGEIVDEEKKRFVERSEKLRNIASPIKAASQIQQEEYDRVLEQLEGKKKEMDAIRGKRGIATDKKKKRLKKEIEELEAREKQLKVRKEKMEQIENIHTSTLSKTEDVLKKKEAEVETRISELKKEAVRRERKMKEIEAREHNLKAKEKRLSQWEARVRNKEQNVNEMELGLKERLAAMESMEKAFDIVKDVHHIEPEDAESGLSPGEWLEAQRRIQSELFSLKQTAEGDDSPEGGEGLSEDKRALLDAQSKVSDLEGRLRERDAAFAALKKDMRRVAEILVREKAAREKAEDEAKAIHGTKPSKADEEVAVEKLEAEHAKMVEGLEAEHAKMVEGLEAEHAKMVEGLEAEHVKAVEKLEKEHVKAVEGLESRLKEVEKAEKENARLASEVEKARKELEKAVGDAESGGKAVEKLEAEHAKMVEGLEAEHAKRVEGLESRLKELESAVGEKDSEAKKGEKEHVKAVEKLEKEHAKAVEGLESRLKEVEKAEKENARLASEVEKARKELESAVGDAESGGKAVEKLEKEHAKAVEKLEAEHAKMVEGLESRLKELESAVGEKDSDAKKGEKEHAKAVEKLEAEHANVVQKLESQNAKLTEEIEKLQAKMDDVIKKAEETGVDEDLLKVLKILDNLLEKLPEDVVDDFATSSDFELYDEVFERYNI